MKKWLVVLTLMIREWKGYCIRVSLATPAEFNLIPLTHHHCILWNSDDTMGNKESHGCCSPTGYSMSESVIINAPVQCVWEMLLHPEYELELIQQKKQDLLIETTLVAIRRSETGPVHRGSQCFAVRREPRRSVITCCGISCLRRGNTMETRTTVTDMMVDTNSNSYSISYSLGAPNTNDIDLQNGTFISSVTLQPCNVSADAGQQTNGEVPDNAPEKCLAVITEVIHVGSFYGYLQELFCKRRIETLVRSYLRTMCSELKVIAEFYSSSGATGEKTAQDASDKTCAMDSRLDD
jgi:hypothetical protein